MRLEGNLINRLMENKIYSKDKMITPNMDITSYSYSDRSCSYVDKVIDQKHIFVKPYYVCADHSKAGGQGHQDWLYFKTLKEENDYLKSVFPDREDYANMDEPEAEEWVYRYNSWQEVTRWTKDSYERAKKNNPFVPYFNEKQLKSLDEGKEILTYRKVGNVSFGVRDYHYDWEF